jgi:cytidylate kinase
VVAIDGPSGSGKGTISSRLAGLLGWRLLDSGALYRIVAAEAVARGVDTADEPALAAMAAALEIRFGDEGIFVDGKDLTNTIRTEEVSKLASQVAALAEVRGAVLNVQRAMRQPPGLVADGRDMGTVVFPDAQLKIYLDASVEVRAERRYNQLKNKGIDANPGVLLANLRERDERDKGRAVAPLKPAKDAVVIDSTELSIDEVLNRVHAEVLSRGLADGG